MTSWDDRAREEDFKREAMATEIMQARTLLRTIFGRELADDGKYHYAAAIDLVRFLKSQNCVGCGISKALNPLPDECCIVGCTEPVCAEESLCGPCSVEEEEAWKV